MKVFPAIIASLVITGLVAVAMFVVGANALLNRNVVPVNNAPASAQAVSSVNAAAAPLSKDQQIQRLQNLVQQYQNREKQYQQQLNDAASRLNQANQQVNQYQQILGALQQAGIIRVSQDGTVSIPRGGFGFGGDDR